MAAVQCTLSNGRTNGKEREQMTTDAVGEKILLAKGSFLDRREFVAWFFLGRPRDDRRSDPHANKIHLHLKKGFFEAVTWLSRHL
jgi:hypothetical protein